MHKSRVSLGKASSICFPNRQVVRDLRDLRDFETPHRGQIESLITRSRLVQSGPIIEQIGPDGLFARHRARFAHP